MVNMILFVLAAAVIAAYLLYQRSFPRPIHGIPYLATSMRPFGDIPDMLESRKQNGEAIRFVLDRCDQIQSPIFQVFMKPFGEAFVVVADSVLIEHILTHRVAEFDLSPLFSDIFRAVVPHAMSNFRTSSNEWRVHRRLMADTMTPKFLHGVVAPQILNACNNLIALWGQKMRLAQGHSFDGQFDITDMMMEAIWGAAFGQSQSITLMEQVNLTRVGEIKVPDNPTEPVSFASSQRPESYEAMSLLGDSSEIPLKTPFSKFWVHKLALLWYSSLRQAMAYKEKYIANKLQQAWDRFSSADDEQVKCAADLLVEKEVFLARKEQRPPNYDSPDVKDELYGFLVAGHETTATTMQWAMKLLTLHQDVQAELRQSLYNAFEGKSVDAKEIADANIPYLDACIFEVLRYGTPGIALARETREDCELLGYRIPAKTQVIMPLRGPGYLRPRNKFDTDLKDPFTGEWQSDTLGLFQPSRWLIDGKFDARAGPMHMFATGPRSCFGRRLALLSMKVILTSVLLAFKLEPIPEELGDFKAIDVLTHRPRHMFISLSKV